MKEKIIKYSEILFLAIYILFSLTLCLTLFKTTHTLKYIILYIFVALFIAIIIKFKNFFKKILNKKYVFILSISIGILLRVSLLFFNYPELTGSGDYQTFFYNASSFSNNNIISNPTYIALFPFLMPYIIILGSFFKVFGISYFSMISLNIILDLFTALFLYFTFKNKSISKCISCIWLLNPINMVWCTVCCPVVLVNFGISASILIFSILLNNINSKKFIIYSILTGIIISISNSFRPIMPIMLIAIALYYIYINLKEHKFNKNYLISFLLIVVFFTITKVGINVAMDKINGQPVSRTAGWTLYIGSNLESNGGWYSEPKLDELLNQGLSPEEVQKEFKKLAIERYKNNGIKNINLFINKFDILTGRISTYVFGQFNATITHNTFLYFIKLALHVYISISFILLIFINLLNAIQNFINREPLKNNILYVRAFS